MITRNSLYKVANYIKLNNLYNLMQQQLMTKLASSDQTIRALTKAFGAQFVQSLRGMSKQQLKAELFKAQNSIQPQARNLETFLSSLLGGKKGGNMDGFHGSFGTLDSGAIHGKRIRKPSGILSTSRALVPIPSPTEYKINDADKQLYDMIHKGVTLGPNAKILEKNTINDDDALGALLGIGGVGAGAAGLGGLLYYNRKNRKNKE